MIIKEETVLFKIKNLDKAIVKCLFSNKLSLIPPTQIQIIGYIIKNRDKKVYQRDLEKVLKLSRATVSGVLITMEKNNLIKRVADEKDLRSKQITLSDTAEEKFTNTKEKIDDINKKLVNGISNEELDLFYSILNKMIENMDSYNI